MKYLIAAVALVTVAPAAAQSAPATQHQDHSQHQQHGQGHGQHQGQDHSQHGQQQGQQHGQHQAHGDCCADRNGNGRMDCCEAMAQSGDRRGCCPEQAPAPSAQPQGHDGH